MSAPAERGRYRLPDKPGFLGGVSWKARLIGFGIALCSQIAATEFLAYRFGQLGLEFTTSSVYGEIGSLPIYNPLCWIKWEIVFGRLLLHGVAPYAVPLVVAALIGILGLAFGLTNTGVSFNVRARKLTKNLDHLYGSTIWITRNGLAETGLLREPRGLLLGAWRENADGPLEYLYDDSDRHVLVVAPTGTGKTTSIVHGSSLVWPGSMIVTDMKAEVYDKTAGWRQKQGHICLKFAPFDPKNSIRLNPFGWVRFGTDYEIGDVQKVAEGIAAPGGETTEEHWNDTATALIEGVLLHEAYKSKVLSKQTVTMADISRSLSPFTVSFTDYLKEMACFIHDPDGLYGWRDTEGNPTRTHPVVRERAMEAAQRSEREASSVLSSAKKRFRIYADPLIQQVTSGCDLQPEDLVDGSQPVSLYLVLPPSEKRRLAPLVRILLLLTLQRLTEKLSPHRHELLFLLDEFPALGYMSPFEDALSYIRGYGMRCLLIVQDLSQIRKRYGNENEIIPNCQILITFTVSDLPTAKAFSEAAGKQTIQYTGIQFSHKNKQSSQLQASSAQLQLAQRPLMEPEELMRLPLAEKIGKRIVGAGEYVMFVFGAMPVRGVQAFTFLDPTFRRWMDVKPVDQSRELREAQGSFRHMFLSGIGKAEKEESSAKAKELTKV